jgi:hypothetical protein
MNSRKRRKLRKLKQWQRPPPRLPRRSVYPREARKTYEQMIVKYVYCIKRWIRLVSSAHTDVRYVSSSSYLINDHSPTAVVHPSRNPTPFPPPNPSSHNLPSSLFAHLLCTTQLPTSMHPFLLPLSNVPVRKAKRGTSQEIA